MLDGGTGIDRLAGGSGRRHVLRRCKPATWWWTLPPSPASTHVISTANSYSLTQTGSTAAGVENLTFAGTGDFTGTGNAMANRITGGEGNDSLSGLAGADRMIGLGGNDTYTVENAGDITEEAAGAAGGHDTVRSSVSHTLQANVEDLVLLTGATMGTGNELDNLIQGNTASNTLDGKEGADVMQGGLGNDTYVVDNVGDVVTELAGQGTDRVRTTLEAYTLGANVEQLEYTGERQLRRHRQRAREPHHQPCGRRRAERPGRRRHAERRRRQQRPRRRHGRRPPCRRRGRRHVLRGRQQRRGGRHRDPHRDRYGVLDREHVLAE